MHPSSKPSIPTIERLYIFACARSLSSTADHTGIPYFASTSHDASGKEEIAPWHCAAFTSLPLLLPYLCITPALTPEEAERHSNDNFGAVSAAAVAVAGAVVHGVFNFRLLSKKKKRRFLFFTSPICTVFPPLPSFSFLPYCCERPA
jgi:hypothetical protein